MNLREKQEEYVNPVLAGVVPFLPVGVSTCMKCTGIHTGSKELPERLPGLYKRVKQKNKEKPLISSSKALTRCLVPCRSFTVEYICRKILLM